MTQEFKRYGKYLVLKLEDIESFLSILDKKKLEEMCDTVGLMRKSIGKKENSYVAVNEDEPYAEIVWKLIEVSQTKPEELPRLLENIQTELAGV